MVDLPEGIHLYNKPKGITSFALVQQIRKKFNEKKVGHAGTLDPLASGLMVIGVGIGTKELRHVVGVDKTYIAEICIGEKSATGDAEGPILERKKVQEIPEPLLKEILTSMQGILRLEVSVYSAMKRGGEALYKKARRGEAVTSPIRDMEIHTAELITKPIRTGNNIYLMVRFVVGSGTYVRSLAEELGKRLGYPARLENLQRVQVGEWHLSEAKEI